MTKKGQCRVGKIKGENQLRSYIIWLLLHKAATYIIWRFQIDSFTHAISTLHVLLVNDRSILIQSRVSGKLDQYAMETYEVSSCVCGHHVYQNNDR